MTDVIDTIRNEFVAALDAEFDAEAEALIRGFEDACAEAEARDRFEQECAEALADGEALIDD